MEDSCVLANKILIDCVFSIDSKSMVENLLPLTSTLVLKFYFVTTLVCEAFFVVLKSTLIFDTLNGQLLNITQSCSIQLLGCHNS